MLSGLNEAQRRAVEHDDGPLMVLAGPGTGKTRVITHRVAHMVLERGFAPESIVAVTYTVKAAGQLRSKLGELVGPAGESVVASTFHGLGLRLVREFAGILGYMPMRGGAEGGRGAGQIVDSAQQRRLLREIILENGLFASSRAQGVEAGVGYVISRLDALSNAAIGPAELREFLDRAWKSLELGRSATGAALDAAGIAAQRVRLSMLEETARAIELYKDECRRRSWLGFDDLILLPIELLRDEPAAAAIVRDRWRHLVVDEFQDVNTAQIRMLELLAPPAHDRGGGDDLGGPDLCVVGDDDQSIYEFRGADERAFARFAAMWRGAGVVELATNYRSTPTIVGLSNHVISLAPTRFAPDKTIVAAGSGTDAPPVEVVHLEDDKQDGEAIASLILLDMAGAKGARAYRDYAVVARSHGDLDRVRASLELEGIPVLVSRTASPEDDQGVRDVLAWVEAIAEPASTLPVVRLLVRPGIGAQIEQIAAWERLYRGTLSRHEHGMPGAADPGGFAEFLERTFPDEPCVARLGALRREFVAVNAHSPATETVFRIVSATDPAHVDLLDPRARASRVEALICLIRFVRDRQERLDPPGDLGALWRYYSDLSADDRSMRISSVDDRIDGETADGEKIDAVRLITAHSAKGLEFDTVFVPRVTPGNGYPKTRGDEGLDLPEGLIDRGPGAGAGDAVTRKLCEERRVFYVACTRAERRLLLLGKKNKSASKSTHFLEEICAAAAGASGPLANVVRTVKVQDVFARAASLGLGLSTARYGEGGAGSEIDAEGRGFRVQERRRDVFEAARRDVRAMAAAALQRADDPGAEDAAIEQASETLGDAARRLSALAYAQVHGKPQAWISDGPVRAMVERALERCEAVQRPRAGGAGGPAQPKAPLDLSFSYLDTYMRCPGCFYVKHVLGLTPAAGQAQVVGLAVHRALEEFFVATREAEATGQPAPTLARLIELGRAAFFRMWPKGLPVDRGQIEQVAAQLRLVVEQLHEPDGQILELEKRVRFDYSGHGFAAVIDRIDQITMPDGRLGWRIIDYKTGGPTKAKTEPKADDLQLGIYAMALSHLFGTGDPAADGLEGFAEYWVLATGQRGVIALSAIRHDKVRKAIDGAVDGILAGRFDPKKDCGGDCTLLGGR